MRLTTGFIVCIATVVLFSVSAGAQVTIDATGPTHGGWKNVNAGDGGGGTGRKLPLQVGIEVYGTPFNGHNGRTVIDFILTNSGKQALTIPLSLHPEELESANTFRHLWLYVTSDKRHEAVLQGGGDPHSRFVNLYGSDAVQGTLATLVPGASIRVRAEVALPEVSGQESINMVFVAHAMVYDKTIKVVSGQPFMASKEVGMATSPEYTWRDLLKRHE